MTTATPPAPYSTLEGALASGFAITQLHHSPGHDLIVGDSQAGDVINMIVLKYADSIQVRSIPSGASCQILASPGFYEEYPDRKRTCLPRNAAILRDPRIAQADTVVLAFAWQPDSPRYVFDDVRALVKEGAKDVVVIGPKTQGSSGMDLVADLGSLDGLEREAYNRLSREEVSVSLALSKFTKPYRYIDLLSIMCPREGFCHVLDGDGIPLLFDKRHFTPEGTRV